MDEMLMLLGRERRCADCGTVTVFLPVDGDPESDEWTCTACDCAVILTGSCPGRASGDRGGSVGSAA